MKRKIPELNITNEVPPETIIRHMSVERGKLLAEIDELKDQLARKDAAITSFKKWQSKVAERNWAYWLSEGIKLMETPPEAEMLNALKKLLGCHRIFKEWEKKVVDAWQQYKKAQERASKILKAEQNETEQNEKD